MKIFFILLFLILFLFSCNKKDSNEIPKLEIYENDNYLNLGNKISSETFLNLSTVLLDKIQKDGIDSAISFCNLNALPITQKLEQQYNVEIKRVGTRIRNKANSPDNIEKEVIKIFDRKFKNGEELKPVIMKINNKYHYFNYIITKPFCLNCHGNPNNEIQPVTYNLIKSKYPDDEAINYKNEDFRGIWHIIFN